MARKIGQTRRIQTASQRYVTQRLGGRPGVAGHLKTGLQILTVRSSFVGCNAVLKMEAGRLSETLEYTRTGFSTHKTDVDTCSNPPAKKTVYKGTPCM